MIFTVVFLHPNSTTTLVDFTHRTAAQKTKATVTTATTTAVLSAATVTITTAAADDAAGCRLTATVARLPSPAQCSTGQSVQLNTIISQFQFLAEKKERKKHALFYLLGKVPPTRDTLNINNQTHSTALAVRSVSWVGFLSMK